MILMTQRDGLIWRHQTDTECFIRPQTQNGVPQLGIYIKFPNNVRRVKTKNQLRSALWYLRGINDRYQAGKITR